MAKAGSVHSDGTEKRLSCKQIPPTDFNSIISIRASVCGGWGLKLFYICNFKKNDYTPQSPSVFSPVGSRMFLWHTEGQKVENVSWHGMKAEAGILGIATGWVNSPNSLCRNKAQPTVAACSSSQLAACPGARAGKRSTISKIGRGFHPKIIFTPAPPLHQPHSNFRSSGNLFDPHVSP